MYSLLISVSFSSYFYSITLTSHTHFPGFIIGILILGAGIYYLAKEKNDPESKKIYTIVSVIGAILAAVCAVLLFI